ncbi:hypothetical protein KKH18_05780, partial [bacterium]|nr:hypothetical protein [bacterium]
DYTISRCSPCSDFLSSCGLIGALDIGCGADPAPVEDLTDTPVYPDVVLNWSPVTTTTCGAPQDVDYYLIFFESDNTEEWDFMNYTADTTYTHPGILQFSNTQFYMVEAYVGSIGVLENLPSGIRIKRSDLRKLLGIE